MAEESEGAGIPRSHEKFSSHGQYSMVNVFVYLLRYLVLIVLYINIMVHADSSSARC